MEPQMQQNEREAFGESFSLDLGLTAVPLLAFACDLLHLTQAHSPLFGQLTSLFLSLLSVSPSLPFILSSSFDRTLSLHCSCHSPLAVYIDRRGNN